MLLDYSEPDRTTSLPCTGRMCGLLSARGHCDGGLFSPDQGQEVEGPTAGTDSRKVSTLMRDRTKLETDVVVIYPCVKI